MEEFIDGINSGTSEVGIARMVSPEGWIEPVQTPEFDEYTVVLSGHRSENTARVTTDFSLISPTLTAGGTTHPHLSGSRIPTHGRKFKCLTNIHSSTGMRADTQPIRAVNRKAALCGGFWLRLPAGPVSPLSEQPSY